jgi:hypothetical protein
MWRAPDLSRVSLLDELGAVLVAIGIRIPIHQRDVLAEFNCRRPMRTRLAGPA